MLIGKSVSLPVSQPLHSKVRQTVCASFSTAHKSIGLDIKSVSQTKNIFQYGPSLVWITDSNSWLQRPNMFKIFFFLVNVQFNTVTIIIIAFCLWLHVHEHRFIIFQS